MEESTYYVAQAWVERYEYWSNVQEPTEGMFSMPRFQYDTEDEGRERLRALREGCPAGKYRLVKVVVTTQEVI